ncbi:MAG: alpha/beta hydrolase [Pseudomonadales bacterium]|nr:alpha/beta hydrolase [Pseudomonadales bacterium]
MSSYEFPFKKDQIRSALTTLRIGQPVTDALPVTRYRKFYGIDFENQIEGVTASLGIIKSAGFDIVTHVFQKQAAKGTVFVFHGLYDHVGIFDKPIQYFLKQGYSVVAYDLPGHGVSSGHWVVIADFFRYQQVLKSVINFVIDQLPQPCFAIAQSTGAAVLIDAMLNHRFSAERFPFKKVVLLAPLVRPMNWPRNRLMHSVLSPFLDFVPRSFTFNSHDHGFLSFLRNQDSLQSRMLSSRWVGALKKWIPKIEAASPVHWPVYIIQGQQDETVDWEHNIPLLKEKFTNLKVSFIAPMRHQVVNETESIRKQVFEKALDFIKQ